ncbi:MAG: hypothetical protein UHG91_09600 [Succinivibrionaceae bacterium]|nr:hypothetical protein [Succinivibrionaceae bacterium]
MALTIALMCIAFAVLLIIGYMIYNDYQVQQDIDKKLIISKQKDIITETDDILLNVTQLPFSTKLVVILQSRVLNALQQIYALNPQALQIKQRIKDISDQIKVNQTSPGQEPNFVPPRDTSMSLKMLKILRRLRKIIRIEFNRGRLSQQDLVREDKRLEVMIFKIQFSNLLRSIDECEASNEYPVMEQLINSGLKSLKDIGGDDPWFKGVEERLQEQREHLLQELNRRHQKAEAEARKSNHKDEMDELFGQKKKW